VILSSEVDDVWKEVVLAYFSRCCDTYFWEGLKETTNYDSLDEWFP
jgi:hypothetical protein